MESRISHLRGRDQLITKSGWSETEAEWIALVCLHSGIFTRRQFEFHFSTNRTTSFRFVKKLIDLELAKETLLGSVGGNRTRAVLIYAKAFYRTISIPNIRHRRSAAPDVMFRRLLSLDYVLEHPGFPWLPTEDEKVGLTDRLGYDREILPQRLYRGVGRDSIRYFNLKLPLAIRPEKRQFVFVYVDPGNGTDTELRHWGESHEKLWNAMRARNYSVHVAGIAMTIEDSTRTSAILKRWAQEKRVGGVLGKSRIAELKHELREITRGVEQNTDSILSRYEGSIGAIARYGEIENILENRAEHFVRIDTYEIWNSRRIGPRAQTD